LPVCYPIYLYQVILVSRVIHAGLMRAIVVVIAVVASVGMAALSVPIYEWPVSNPDDENVDQQLIYDMLAHIDQANILIHSISIIRNGSLILDVYYENDDFGYNEPHPVCSCTKSVISLLIGIAVDQGLIGSVDVPVLDFFPEMEVEFVTARKEAMTLDHLLTMTAGYRCNNDADSDSWDASTDHLSYVLDWPVSYTPGARWDYCNGVSYLLSAILTEATGMSAFSFAYEYLFRPLGIVNVVWDIDNWNGINLGHTGLYLRPHDMAKIGQLVLNHGTWDGKQIVPAQWVEQSMIAHATSNETGIWQAGTGYGYQWWVDPKGYAFAIGQGAQVIFIVPNKNMVVVFTSVLFDEDQAIPEELLNTYIIPAAH